MDTEAVLVNDENKQECIANVGVFPVFESIIILPLHSYNKTHESEYDCCRSSIWFTKSVIGVMKRKII